ncbi:MAG TPA: TIGR00266 family protein [Polyangiales bacterium]|nr:TIGR00266 family protein [Polyangiales bacterium]
MPSLAFDILQRPEFAMLRLQLEAGQRVFSEPSAMAGMAPAIELKAGLKGGLMGSVGRMFAGENLVVNTYRAARGPGELLLAPAAVGDIMHYRLARSRLLLQRGSYLANSEGVEVSASWAGARGFFSGQGLVLLQAQGDGDIFFNAYGAVLQIDVSHDYIVDTGYVVAFEDTLQYNVSALPGLGIGKQAKSFFFGGEGLVVRFSGQGKVWVQTRTIGPLLNWVHAFRPQKRTD